MGTGIHRADRSAVHAYPVENQKEAMMMGILDWDKPKKAMSTEEWQSISADGAPPGVYVPNMSDDDMKKWKAKLIGGKNPRVEIRKTVAGSPRPAPKRMQSWTATITNYAQVLIIVDADSVRISANGTMDFQITEFIELDAAVKEARLVLLGELGLKEREGN